MSKTLYHGTVDVYVPQILKEGLKPNPNNSWKISSAFLGSLRDVELEGYIYVAEDEREAELFAFSKAEYLRVAPGEIYKPIFLDDVFVKELNTPYFKDAKPVLLSVIVPEHTLTEFERDPRSNGLKYKGIIPPNRIRVEAASIAEIADIALR